MKMSYWKFSFIIKLVLLFIAIVTCSSKESNDKNAYTDDKIFNSNNLNVNYNCLWSNYRPGPYFGFRSKTKDSPLIGLLWYYPEKMYSVRDSRHFMEVSDEISRYEWTEHNGCDFGRLIIEDKKMNVSFKVEFYSEKINNASKSNSNPNYNNDNNDSNHWVIRVSGNTYDKENKGIVVMWYVSNTSSNNNNTIPNFTEGLLYNTSERTVIGKYNIPTITNSNDTTNSTTNSYKINKTFYIKSTQKETNTYPTYNNITYSNPYFIILNIDDSKLHNPLNYIITQLKDPVGDLPNHLLDINDSYFSASIKQGNVFIEQIFLISDFSFDINFFEDSVDKKELDYDVISEKMEKHNSLFYDKFNEVFGNSISNTDNNDNSKTNLQFLIDYMEDNNALTNNNKNKNETDYNKLTAISAVSGLFSNIIYMTGNLQILDKETNNMKYSPEYELLTIAPDKTSHGRGFMWDEGFQQRILSLWNLEMSLSILSNWFSNIDKETGWLAREQSLDNESRERALPSSWAAIPGVSNPPALIYLISELISRAVDKDNDNDKELITRFLSSNISNIEKNALWYVTSQLSTNSIPYLFSWKGKTDDFCLPSGLDDYPRCRLEGKSYIEGHLDLQSWIIALSQTMTEIYSFILKEKLSTLNKISEIELKDLNNKRDYWKNVEESSYNVLLEYFWDDDRKQFDDFYLKEIQNNKSTKITRYEKVFSNHTGYISLFPLILDNFKNKYSISSTNTDYSKYIDSIISLIIDSEKGLKTNYGIRSLSIEDSYYNKGTKYWTSPIWVNINYLIIKNLNVLRKIEKYNYLDNEYKELRRLFVNNIVKNVKENGFIWEVYDDITGEGKYNRPFTGWSSLIVNLIYEKY